jgi:hypothetical protein
MDDDVRTAVLDVVTDGTRLAIVEALADAYAADPRDHWVAYSELREAAGVDDKGNFNYHLNRLGPLVESGDDGYRISRVGQELVSAVASGNFRPDWTWGPFDVPGECWDCGDSLALTYHEGVLRLTCGDDAHAIALSTSPVFLTTGPEDSLVERIAVGGALWGIRTRHGICSECEGYVDTALDRHPEDGHVYLHGDCRACGFQHGIPVGSSLRGHPDVVAFYRERGEDVRTTPFWTLDWCEPGTETVLSEDPLRVRVDVEAEGDTLSVVVDADGSVAETERLDE